MQGGPGFQSDGSVRDIIQASGDVRGFENSKFLRIFLQVKCLELRTACCPAGPMARLKNLRVITQSDAQCGRQMTTVP